MKKFFLLFILCFFCVSAFSQKKKPVKKPTSTNVIAKSENLTAALVQSNEQLRFEFSIDNKGSKDTLFSKKIEVDSNAKSPLMKNNNIPFECKISPLLVKGILLHYITWSEIKVSEVPDKTEEQTKIYNEIWNVITKTQVLSNVQTVTKIKEILWLDKLKNASQTSEKLRREGFAFSLNKDGEVVLKNKTQENKLIYNPVNNSYENTKSNPAAAVKSSKKK